LKKKNQKNFVNLAFYLIATTSQPGTDCQAASAVSRAI